MKRVGALPQVRKTIQASIFRALGFDIGFYASAMATDAVLDELARFGVEVPRDWRLVHADPIEELRAEPFPPLDDGDDCSINEH